MEVAIISIGNEVLKGHTANSNYTFLSRQITLMGNHVKRGYIVSDDPREIAWALDDSMKIADFIVTTGGLGPTYDDMTLDSVSSFLHLKMTKDEATMERLAERLKARNIPITEDRMKMAYIPEGSEAIPNPVGSAPGILISHSGKYILCLPGVPAEMEAIFKNIRDRFQNGDMQYYEDSLEFPGTMEADMAPLIREEMKKKGDLIYIKSHPVSNTSAHFGVILEISCYNRDAGEARKMVREELNLFRDRFSRKDQ